MREKNELTWLPSPFYTFLPISATATTFLLSSIAPHPLCAQLRARYQHSVKCRTLGHRCSSSTSPCGSVTGRTTSIFVFLGFSWVSSLFTHRARRILVLYYHELAYKNPRTWPHQRQATAPYFAFFRPLPDRPMTNRTCCAVTCPFRPAFSCSLDLSRYPRSP